MFKKLVPVGLTLMLLASACGGGEPSVLLDTAEEPAVTVDVPETAATSENVEPDLTDTDQLFVDEPEPLDENPGSGNDDAAAPVDNDERLSRPGYDPEGDAALFLYELVVWVLQDGDTDGPQAASECYAQAFVDALTPDRVKQIADLLDQLPLSDGLPVDAVTEQELTQLFAEADACADLLKEEITAGFGTLDAPAGFDQEASDSCYTEMEDADKIDVLVAASMFDSPAAQEAMGLFMLRNCTDTFLIPLLVETFVTDDGVEREIAECIAPKLAEAMLSLSDEALLLISGSANADPASGLDDATQAATDAIQSKLLATFVVCGYLPGLGDG